MARFGAVETGGTAVRCAWGAAPGDLRDVETFPTGDDPEAVVERLGAYFDAHPVDAVGVAAFGPLEVDPVSPRWGTLLETPKPGWSHAPLGPRLRERCGVPVAIDSDVNAAALAEVQVSPGAPHAHPAAALAEAGNEPGPLIYVTVGTGLGMGAVVGGRTLRGLLHPEAGHLRLRREPGDDFPGACPFHGDCLEGLTCGPAIAARVGADPATLPPDHEAWALEAVYLARGLAAMTLVLVPRTIVLGGGVGRRPGLREAVAARLGDELAGSFDRAPMLRAPALEHSGLAGALALAAGNCL